MNELIGIDSAMDDESNGNTINSEATINPPSSCTHILLLYD